MQKEFIEWRKSNVSSILWLHGIRKLYLDLLRDGMKLPCSQVRSEDGARFTWTPF